MDIIAAIDTATGCQHCGGPLGDSPSDDFCSPEHQAAWLAARTVPLTDHDEPEDLPVHVGNLVELHNPETCVTCTDRTPAAHRHVPDALLALVYAHTAARQARAARPSLSIGPLADAVHTALDTAVTRPGRSVWATNATGADGFENYRRRWMLGFDGARDTPPVLHSVTDGRIYVADVDTPYEADGDGGWREFGTITDEPAFTNTAPADTDPRAVLLGQMGLAHIDPEAMRAQLAPLAAAFEAVSESLRPLSAITFEAVQVSWDAVRRYFGGEPEQAFEPDGPADPRARALWLRQHRNTGPNRQHRPPRAINPRRAR